jgi:capsid protein
LIGVQSLRPNTTDAAFNAAVEKQMERRLLSPKAFDVANKWNWETCQIGMNTSRLRDGDMLVVLSETSTGQARFAFYEGGQIRTPRASANDGRWRDGVKVDKQGRHIAYGVAEYGTDEVTVIAAEHCVYFADFERRGQVRGISALSHALTNILDKVETYGDIKASIKLAALFGIYEKEGETKTFGQALGGGFLDDDGNSIDPCDVGGSSSSGGVADNVERVLGSPYIAKVSRGGDIGTISDDRPGPNQQEFWNEIVRDIAWGVGLSPAVIWDISSLTGPAVRYTLNEVEAWCKHERRLIRQVLSVMYVYWLAKEIKAGTVPTCKDPDWWRMAWYEPGKLSIDVGRDGQLRMSQIKEGVATLDSWASDTGVNWQDVIDQRVKETAYAKAQCEAEGLDPAELFPALFPHGHNSSGKTTEFGD